ncbi:hypothetical protein FB451DRAFT_1558538 [Mycena latifolia]|nr:hypothetical protein FB451DRAFT_1558538 [Mycena latifolia]
MSSQPTRTISQNFRISLDDSPQNLSIDVIVSSGGDIQLDVRSQDSITGRSRILDVRALGTGSRSAVTAPHTLQSSAIASSSRLAPPTQQLQTHETNARPQQMASTSLPPPHSSPGVPERIYDEQDIPPPAYEPPNGQASPPSAPEDGVPHSPAPIVYGEAGPIEFEPRPRPPPPPIRPILRELYEAMQRGEFVPQILVDETEQPTFPLNLSGRRRRHEESSDDEEEDEAEERYAKRNRVSWGPLDFLRLWS